MQAMVPSLRFIFRKDIDKIFAVFTDLFGIRIAFFSNDGHEVNVGKNKPMCCYCRLLRDRLGYEDICLKLDQKKRQEAAERRKLIVYQCHGGMTEAITPIYIEDDLIGYVMIGQFRTMGESVPHKIRRLLNRRIGPEELEIAYKKTPCYESSYTESILTLFSVLIDLIVSRRLVEIGNSNSVRPIISFMEEHVEENLSLAQASKILSQSRSSLSHGFRKETGESFKQFQIRLKLDKADEYFKKKPEISVKEVALRLGFEDQFYFSRLYKKHRGESPTAAKKRLNFS